MDFASRLSELIVEKNLNNLRLSKEIGASDSLIGEWRRGSKRPSLDNIILLAEFFSISIDYLVGRSEARIFDAKKEPAPGISENGRELLELYEQLPEREQVLLIGRVQQMVVHPVDTRRVFMAARGNGDGVTDGVCEISKARLDKIKSAEETKKDL